MPDPTCDKTCPGNSSQKCGGTWKFGVYTNWACGPPPAIAHGSATLRRGTNVTYGSIADVYCDPGFIGQSTITCLPYTSWEYATCKKLAARNVAVLGRSAFIPIGHVDLHRRLHMEMQPYAEVPIDVSVKESHGMSTVILAVNLWIV
ncbi:hypothetical protein DPMN_126085 [Dreissena polymorpha]|uniref:Sushi domain-containing protein n=1 Tax=Dreissena polymorpha TaxID=45954 RepID=A0A9D4H2N5_DREPO|nr:hypothetical protein DPMN_126085 [Dreissena polymorpha]